MLEINGQQGEGGGQVLRTSLTLSALTQRPFHLYNIRAGRKKPGLAAQHLTAVHLMAEICRAEVKGAALGSTQLVFAPQGPPQAGEYLADVAAASKGGSAGSITLIAQTALLPLAFAAGASELTLRGGTHVPWSPPAHYFAEVYLPLLAKIGVAAQFTLIRWGFYPAGGGEALLQVAGGATALQPLQQTTAGALEQVRGLGVAAELPSDIAQRIANRLRNRLREVGLAESVQPERVRGVGPGAAAWLLAESQFSRTGVLALGAKGKPAAEVADEAVDALLAVLATGAAVDGHLADQLVLPLALAAGGSALTVAKITQHLLTQAAIIGLWLPKKIEIIGTVGQAGQVLIGD